MRIVASKFRDMRNLLSVVFGLLKMWYWAPKKSQLSLSERWKQIRFSGNGQKSLNKFENTQVRLE